MKQAKKVVKKGVSIDLENKLEESGENMRSIPVSTTLPQTDAERAAAVALQEAGFEVVAQHRVGPWSFDFKIVGHQVLIEIDGSIHDNYSKRLRDLQKDRDAAKRGFRVLRFANDEDSAIVVADVKSVVGSMRKVPREVWIVDETLWERFKRVVLGR